MEKHPTPWKINDPNESFEKFHVLDANNVVVFSIYRAKKDIAEFIVDKVNEKPPLMKVNPERAVAVLPFIEMATDNDLKEAKLKSDRGYNKKVTRVMHEKQAKRIARTKGMIWGIEAIYIQRPQEMLRYTYIDGSPLKIFCNYNIPISWIEQQGFEV